MFAGAKSVYFYKCSRWFFFGFSRVAGCGRGSRPGHMHFLCVIHFNISTKPEMTL